MSLLVNNNSQNDVYRLYEPHRAVINHEGRPTIVDTLLTLILKMAQGAFHIPFCI